VTLVPEELPVDELRARLAVLERVQGAIGRLADAGPPSVIVERAPPEAAEALGLGRVLLSRIHDAALVAEALHAPGSAGALDALREKPVALGYPLLEAEALRRRRPLLVEGGEPGRCAFAAVMGWRDYVAAPILLEARVIGFLHGDRAEGPGPGPPADGAAVTALDRDALARFAEGFALVFERAVLRRRLRVQREELRQVASWADARVGELSDGVIDLTPDRSTGADVPERPEGDPRLRDLLTRREVDVLEHMVRGETNADIARALVVSEGTIKFHVKNILRKLHASNRAEATSRYLRLSLRRDGNR
jgi:LuxR family transcriptional regulator, regulator of acetate metabolism